MSYRVFTKTGCGTCRSVVTVLKALGVDFSEIDVATDAGLRLAHEVGIQHSGAIIDENNKIISLQELRASVAAAMG